MPVDDTATPSFELNKQSLTKLRILNDKVSSAFAHLVTPSCFFDPERRDGLRHRCSEASCRTYQLGD